MTQATEILGVGTVVLDALASILKLCGSIGENGTNTVAYRVGVTLDRIVAAEAQALRASAQASGVAPAASDQKGP